ncbi:Ala-tRNA(Pro) hydrolase [Rhizobiales bacterium GAS188]|nr:Ala-tRNA(Pro) hydrolase [Rhizobiales bacterium GAS188]
MSRAFYHDHPDQLTLETEVVESRPGRLVLSRSPFFQGGGGQLADRGHIGWSGGEAVIAGFESIDGRHWVLLAQELEITGKIEVVVDAKFRRMMTLMHTYTHILNACVYRSFDRALVTGVQMNDDGTARMDFDLPDADNDRLRALEAPINAAIAEDLRVSDSYVPLAAAQAEPGLIRTRSVAPPPTSDGLVRIVEIAGLDRQACGGTHLPSTRGERRLRILKIDNKGRHNRRIRIALD